MRPNCFFRVRPVRYPIKPLEHAREADDQGPDCMGGHRISIGFHEEAKHVVQRLMIRSQFESVTESCAEPLRRRILLVTHLVDHHFTVRPGRVQLAPDFAMVLKQMRLLMEV